MTRGIKNPFNRYRIRITPHFSKFVRVNNWNVTAKWELMEIAETFPLGRSHEVPSTMQAAASPWNSHVQKKDWSITAKQFHVKITRPPLQSLKTGNTLGQMFPFASFYYSQWSKAKMRIWPRNQSIWHCSITLAQITGCYYWEHTRPLFECWRRKGLSTGLWAKNSYVQCWGLSNKPHYCLYFLVCEIQG